MKKKTVKKIIYFLAFFFAGLSVFAWVYPNFMMKIDTSEVDRYYDILSRESRPSKDLILDLGVKEDDSLQLVVDRIKDGMGLKKHTIWIKYTDLKKPPAFIEKLSDDLMEVHISRSVKQKREQINVLIHELGHIYVWNFDASVLKGCNLEKFNDCAGVFLGFGVLMLNGLTDDIFFVPGLEYQTEKKAFGYIRPEQLGYLLARYCADSGINEESIMPFLGPAGRKYFNMGRNCFRRTNKRATRYAIPALGAFWCPRCGYFTRTPLTWKIADIKCPKCSGKR